MNRESVLMPTTGGYAGGLANKRLVSNPDLSNKLLSKRPNLSRPGLSSTFGGKPLQGKSLNNPNLLLNRSSLKATFNLQPLLQSRARPRTTNSVLDSLTKRVSTENTSLQFKKLRLEPVKTSSSALVNVSSKAKLAKKRDLMLVEGGSFAKETSVGRLSNPMLVGGNLKREGNLVGEAKELLVMEDKKVFASLNLDKIDRSCLSFKHRGMLPALYKSLTIQSKEGKQQQNQHERDDAWKKIFGDIDEVVQDLYTNREFYIDPSLMKMNFDVTEESTTKTKTHGFQEKMALLKLVSIALVDPPQYKLQDYQTQEILDNLNNVVSIDPEFVLKVALYARKDLNIRKMSNFILAFCATNTECKRYLKKYFRACINLPSDWMEVAELVSVFQPKNKKQVMPASLRKVMADKFADFNEYQLAKYNKTASKKKKVSKEKKNETPLSAANEEDEDNTSVASDEHLQENDGKGEKFTMKQLVRKLHISKPAKHVMQLLGKKYPSTMDDYFSAGLSGEWDSALSGQRMKLPIPQTWETQCSQLGNKAHVWEKLIDERTLPYMACLRNIRNMMKAGISYEHHKKVLKWICNENAVANGKQFPIRYFSCYDVLDELEKALQPQPPKAPQRGRGRGRKEEKPPKWVQKKEQKKHDVNYDLDLVNKYRKALNEAIEVAVRRNLPPIEGHTIIECYFTGEEAEMSFGGGKRKVSEVQILMALMCAYSCESFTFLLTREGGMVKYELEKGGILKNLATLSKNIDVLIPIEDGRYSDHGENCAIMRFLETSIFERKHFDNYIRMGLSHFRPSIGQASRESYVQWYRAKVNPKMRTYDFDLGSRSTQIMDHDLDCTIYGYSDHLLRFVAENGNNELMNYVDRIDVTKGLIVEEADKMKARIMDDGTDSLPFTTSIKYTQQTIKIFLSSTTKDMHAERNMLIRSVLPELQRRAGSRGIRLLECDLRWGITVQAKNQHRVVQTCLDEIDRCRIFVGMVGDRYGWCPTSIDLPADDKHDWLQTADVKGLSITHLEILSALRKSSDKMACYFYLRNGDQLKKELPKKWHDDFVENNTKGKRKLSKLREFLMDGSDRFSTKHYDATFDGVVNTKPMAGGMENFGQLVLNDLWQCVQDIADKEEASKHLEDEEDVVLKTAKQHLTFAGSRKFVGHQRLVRDCRDLLYKTDMSDRRLSHVICINGDAGVGKTALMTALFDNTDDGQERYTQHSKLFYMVGGQTYHACDLQFMFQCLTIQLNLIIESFQLNEQQKSLLQELSSSNADADDEEIDGGNIRLWKILDDFKKVKPAQTFLIGIDAIDRLAQGHGLQWIPEKLPSNVTLVVSTCSDNKIMKILSRRSDIIQHNLPRLGIKDQKTLLSAMMAEYSKSLEKSGSNNEQKAILRKKDSVNPLFLRVLSEYMRLFASFDTLCEDLDSIPHSLVKLLELWLERVESEFKSISFLVPLITGIILCCQDYGINENELYSIFQFYCENRKRSNEGEIISRSSFLNLLHSLQIFFTHEISRDGSEFTVKFSHEINAQAVRNRYFHEDAADISTIHKLLAKYYLHVLCEEDVLSENRSCGLLRLPYHLAYAGEIGLLRDILENIRFITAKCAVGYAPALLSDYVLLRKLEKFQTDENSMSKDLQSMISSSLHLLEDHPDMLVQLAMSHDTNIGSKFYSEFVDKDDSMDDDCAYLLHRCSDVLDSLEERCVSTHKFRSFPKCVQFSPSGSLLACGTTDSSVYVIDHHTAAIRHRLIGGKTSVSCLYFINDDYLLSGHLDGELIVWNATEGYLSKRLEGNKRRITSITVSHSTSMLATSSLDGVTKIFQLRSDDVIIGPVLTITSTKKTPVNCVALHPTILKIAAGTWDSTIEMNELKNGKRVAVIRHKGESSSFTSVKFSPCGNFIFGTLLYQEGINMWTSDTGILLWSLGRNVSGRELFPATLALVPKTEVMIAAGANKWCRSEGNIEVISNQTGKITQCIGIDSEETGSARCCAYGNNNLFAVGYNNGTLAIFNRVKNKLVGQVSEKPRASITCLRWMDDLLLVGYVNGKLKIYMHRQENIYPVADLVGHKASVNAVVVCDDLIASASNVGNILLWRFEKGKTKYSPFAKFTDHIDACLCLALSPLNQLLASGGKDATLRLWNLQQQQQSSDVEPIKKVDFAHDDWITACAWKKDGSLLVTGSQDAMIKVWSSDGSLKMSLKFHTSPITCLLFGKTCLLSSSMAGEACLWMKGRHPVTTLRGEAKWGEACSVDLIDHDEDGGGDDQDYMNIETVDDWAEEAVREEWKGKHEENLANFRVNQQEDPVLPKEIAICSSDGKTRIWSPSKANKLSSFVGHSSRVIDVASSTDFCASSSLDGTIKCWLLKNQSKSQETTASSGRHEFAISSMKMKGKLITSGSVDGEVKLWKLMKHGELQLLASIKSEKSLPVVGTIIEKLEDEVNITMLTSLRDGSFYRTKMVLGEDGEHEIVHKDPKPRLANCEKDLERVGITISFWDCKVCKKLGYIQVGSYYPTCSPNDFNLPDDRREYQYEIVNRETCRCLPDFESAFFNEKSVRTGDKDLSNVTCMEVDGLFRFVGRQNGQVIIWYNEAKIDERQLHKDAISDISVNGDLIATCSLDRTLKIWKRTFRYGEITLLQLGQHFITSSLTNIQLTDDVDGCRYVICGDASGSVFTIEVVKSSFPVVSNNNN